MSFKDILVLLDNHGNYKSRLKVALSLAQRNNARLVAIYYCELPQMPSTFINPADTLHETNKTLREAYERERDTAYETAASIEAMFHREATRAGVPGIWELRPESPKELVNLVTLRARYADITVLGQSDPDHPLFHALSKLPEDVMLGCGRPVLIVPYTRAGNTFGKRILIAWNGSREAARAVADALPLLQSAEVVTVLMVGEISDNQDEAELPVHDLVKHLAQHSVRAEASYLELDELPAEDIILSRSADLGCDLIVMGGYGHSRTREIILGGVTRAILRHMTAPVLMSH